MLPIVFGAENRRLFGILHSRAENAPPSGGVILCGAFGREAIRAHRIYRVLADRLSRAGRDVLRFDYFGAGDSGGECGEADLEGWSSDLLAAHQELLRRSGVPRVTWVGMRIGTAVAQLAARAAPAEVKRLVLWDPVADGRDYLDMLRARHLEWATSNEGPLGPIPRVFRDRSDFYIGEAIGFAISKDMCDQMRALRFAPAAGAAYETHVICDPQTDEGRAIVSICRNDTQSARLVEVAHGTDWTGERDSTGLVPAPAMKLLFQAAEGVS